MILATGLARLTGAQAPKGAETKAAKAEATEEGPTSFGQAVKHELGTLADEDVTLLDRVLRGVVLVLLAWVAYRLVTMGLKRAEGRLQRAAALESAVQVRRQQHIATVVDLAQSVARYVILITTGILLLDWTFGVNVIPLVTGAGILGLAIAFGSQALVRDVVTGLFQLLEGQYGVGDYVQIGAAFGKVEEVGLRVTRLRDLQDRLYFVPNGSITLVTTYDDPFTDYVLQAPIEKPEQAPEASEALRTLAVDLRAEFPELVGHTDDPYVTSTTSGLVSIRMRWGVVPTQDWLATSEVPARVKQLFAQREIAIPEGRAPTCYVDISPLARMPHGAEKK
jgi:small-conductance mechanosensitive channel